MNDIEVIGLGHLCQDIICVLPSFIKRASSNHVTQSLISAGGAASQAMVCYSRLGGKSAFIGTLGDDSIGDYLKEGLRAEKVDITFLNSLKDTASSYSVVLVEEDSSERSFVVNKPTKNDLELTEELKDYIKKAHCLHIDGTNTREQLPIVKYCKEQGILISMDGCSMHQDTKESIEIAKYADVLILNEHFPEKLCGIADTKEALLHIAKWGAEVVASTLGSKGLIFVKDGEVYSLSAYNVDAIDTTGAGDVFHGAFLYSYIRDRDIENALRFASAVSAINCISLGGRNGIPSLDQTLDFINNHEALKLCRL